MHPVLLPALGGLHLLLFAFRAGRFCGWRRATCWGGHGRARCWLELPLAAHEPEGRAPPG